LRRLDLDLVAIPDFGSAQYIGVVKRLDYVLGPTLCRLALPMLAIDPSLYSRILQQLADLNVSKGIDLRELSNDRVGVLTVYGDIWTRDSNLHWRRGAETHQLADEIGRFEGWACSGRNLLSSLSQSILQLAGHQ